MNCWLCRRTLEEYLRDCPDHLENTEWYNHGINGDDVCPTCKNIISMII